MRIFSSVILISSSLIASAANAELHKGSFHYSASSFDGTSTIASAPYTYDGDSSGIGFTFFYDDNLQVSAGKFSGEITYGKYISLTNLKCDTEQTQFGLTYHLKRSDLRAGTGEGRAIGFVSANSDTDCESTLYTFDALSSSSTYLELAYTKGMGDGLNFFLNFVSDTDDLFQDRDLSFGLLKHVNEGVAVQASLGVDQTAKDNDGDYSDSSSFSIAIGYLF